MRKKPPGLLDSHCDVTVLAVDTARNSGWAIRQSHRLKYSGEIDTLDYEALEQICALTFSIHCTAHCRNGPVLVLEKPYGGRHSVIASLGQARERWLMAWARVGLPHARKVLVNPSTWRSRVLERGVHCLPREQVRDHERVSAQAEVRAGIELGPDERAAILISRWAVRAPEVAALCKGGRA